LHKNYLISIILFTTLYSPQHENTESQKRDAHEQSEKEYPYCG